MLDDKWADWLTYFVCLGKHFETFLNKKQVINVVTHVTESTEKFFKKKRKQNSYLRDFLVLTCSLNKPMIFQNLLFPPKQSRLHTTHFFICSLSEQERSITQFTSFSRRICLSFCAKFGQKWLITGSKQEDERKIQPYFSSHNCFVILLVVKFLISPFVDVVVTLWKQTFSRTLGLVPDCPVG